MKQPCFKSVLVKCFKGGININIFEFIENKITRTLSPNEYEIIKNWKDSKETRDLIDEKFSLGITNIKYIDKVLYTKDKENDTKPYWLDNDIKIEKPTTEELNEMENIINKYKNRED